jgi:hypothetical protein
VFRLGTLLKKFVWLMTLVVGRSKEHSTGTQARAPKVASQHERGKERKMAMCRKGIT